MASHGSADGDVRRLDVANFADHDDVRVLPQNVTQTFREGEINLRFHVNLGDTRQAVFDRLFDRDDPALHRVDAGEKTIKRCRFPAAGRAGEQNDSVGLPEQMANDAFLPLAQIQTIKTELLLAAAEET